MQFKYEGKAKKIWEINEPGILVQEFKDDVTAFNNVKHEIMPGKGQANNTISSFLMDQLNQKGIKTHFIKKISDNSQKVICAKTIRIEFVIRNYVAGSMCKRMNMKNGSKLTRSIIELFYKEDSLGDPFINDDHAVHALTLISQEDLQYIKSETLKINDILIGIFLEIGFKFIDAKFEFGYSNGKVLLIDEISPDTCRLWDIETNEIYDKDIFRHEQDRSLVNAYQEVVRRLGA